jgi:hypothetical protein
LDRLGSKLCNVRPFPTPTQKNLPVSLLRVANGLPREASRPYPIGAIPVCDPKEFYPTGYRIPLLSSVIAKP